MPEPETTRVLLIEDHAMIAQGLRAALDLIDDIDVVAVAGNIEEGVQQARGHEPHVVLLDFRLPDGDAPDGIVRLHKARPEAKVLIVSAMSDYRSVVSAMEAGASGYLLKDQPINDLIAGIRRASAPARPSSRRPWCHGSWLASPPRRRPPPSSAGARSTSSSCSPRDCRRPSWRHDSTSA